MGLWRLPRLEVHPHRELEDDVGVERIGLGSTEGRPCELTDGSRVGDHDLHTLGSVQGKRQVKAVVPGRLEDDTGVSALLRNHANQPVVPLGIVDQIEGLRSFAFLIDDRGEGLRADIDSDIVPLFQGFLLVYTERGLPDPESSPTRLVNPGSRASDTPRRG